MCIHVYVYGAYMSSCVVVAELTSSHVPPLTSLYVPCHPCGVWRGFVVVVVMCMCMCVCVCVCVSFCFFVFSQYVVELCWLLTFLTQAGQDQAAVMSLLEVVLPWMVRCLFRWVIVVLGLRVLCVCIYVCIYVCVYVYVHICVCVCVCR